MTFEEMGKQLPPYVSYKTLIQLIGNQKEALPAYFDTSYLSETFSIVTATQLTHALNFLNLINGDYRPTTRLKVIAALFLGVSHIMSKIGVSGVKAAFSHPCFLQV